MRRIFIVICTVLLLCGCGKNDSIPDKMLSLRQRIQNGCSFDTQIIADYGDRSYTFSMNCTLSQDGEVRFRVTEPESIAGISGVLGDISGGITFDDQVLAFEMMADGQITPVSAPWHLIEALRGGYLHGYCETKEGMQVQINDSYMGENIMSEILLDSQGIPLQCQLFWSGRRFMTLTVSNFSFL